MSRVAPDVRSAAILLSAVLSAAAASHPLEVYATPQRLVSVAGGAMNLYCTSAGGPVVVLEAGLGFPNISWRKVQPVLATRMRVCSYDRAGLGFSAERPGPRTPQRLAGELHAMLEAAGERPPYVVVGSSYGGLVVRAFAGTFREDTAGVVLVDPVVPELRSRLVAIAPTIARDDAKFLAREARCLPLLERRALTAVEAERRKCTEAVDATWPPAVRTATMRQWLSPAGARTARLEGQALDEVHYIPMRLGALPIVVLTAGRSFADETFSAAVSGKLLDQWRRGHVRLAQESSVGEERLIASAGHVIQTSEPNAVVQAIDDVRSRAMAHR